jgi:hypothetical protein
VQQFRKPGSPTHRLARRIGEDPPGSHQVMSPPSTTIIFLTRFRDLASFQES